ncbi:carboxypeptidase-like regulatory domain-containing protein [[Flexibacter] sp. ATCC 35103]|uniref:carboxypeptidase-like regulatory domain-containing protein n=1 Tax=[Flexibacter] sp. ATCC 35103 TaxID=1937528 RepID=UPI0013F5A5BE|nr:carboxypeptidase-like regulatory domain-containing protein [[Flexibacter] sp. ATCC 35103]
MQNKLILKVKLIILSLLFCSCTNNTLSGHVYDYDTGEPLSNVQIDSNGNKTETDINGYFNIKIKPNNICRLSLKKEGYEAKKVKRKPDSLGLFSQGNIKNRKIYLFNKESDFSNKRSDYK